MIILTKKNIIKTTKYIIIAILILAIIFFVDMKNNKKTIITSAEKTKNTYEILVDVEDSVLYLFQNEKLIKTYSCSGGKWSTPSPIGEWKITGKDTWGEGFRTEGGWG